MELLLTFSTALLLLLSGANAQNYDEYDDYIYNDDYPSYNEYNTYDDEYYDVFSGTGAVAFQGLNSIGY